jgi:hypothetical protein
MRGEGGSGRVLATPTAALEITPEGTSFITFVDRPKLARSLAAGTALGVLLTAVTGNQGPAPGGIATAPPTIRAW